MKQVGIGSGDLLSADSYSEAWPGTVRNRCGGQE